MYDNKISGGIIKMNEESDKRNNSSANRYITKHWQWLIMTLREDTGYTVMVLTKAIQKKMTIRLVDVLIKRDMLKIIAVVMLTNYQNNFLN